HVTHYLFEQTQRSPIVIPVVNIVGSGKPNGDNKQQQGAGRKGQPKGAEKTPEQIAKEQQERFAQMRQQLLGHDPRVD
ncbi:hypothetical protein KC963_01820, partial [Candidatus Saccharibacteria bacterium]|nr:hypothetical protein [Candidatus Saccharibacteria bacterium]